MPQADRQGAPSGVPEGDAVRSVQAAGGTPLSEESPPRPPRGRRIALLATLAAVIYALDLVTKFLVVEFLEDREPVVLIGCLGAERDPQSRRGVQHGHRADRRVLPDRHGRRHRDHPYGTAAAQPALGDHARPAARWGHGQPDGPDLPRARPAPGHVVDFVQVFPATRFPVFNVADSAIVCGGILAVFLAWRGFQIDGTRQDQQEEARADG